MYSTTNRYSVSFQKKRKRNESKSVSQTSTIRKSYKKHLRNSRSISTEQNTSVQDSKKTSQDRFYRRVNSLRRNLKKSNSTEIYESCESIESFQRSSRPPSRIYKKRKHIYENNPRISSCLSSDSENSENCLSTLSSLSRTSSSGDSSFEVKHFKYRINHIINKKYLVILYYNY